MARYLFRLFFLWSSVFSAALLVAALALPWWFERIEVWSEQPLPYEGILRLTITAVAVLLFLGSLLWLTARGERRHWLIWSVMALSFVTLLPVFFLDTSHRLMEEFSWIRYTTAGFLLLAAVVAVLLARFYHLEAKEKHLLAFFWLLIAGAFLYAGIDEVFEIHEALGRFAERTFRLPHVTTDFITVGYALVALVVLFVFFRRFLAEYQAHSLVVTMFAFGGVVYFVSTMFDTVDVVLGRKLETLARVLSIDPAFVFGDAWYTLWAPKNFFNGVEEVFEHTAAVLFFTALLLLFLEKRSVFLERRVVLSNAWRSRGVFAVIGILLAFLVPSLALSSPNVFARAPFIDTKGVFAVSRIAGYYDGLFHTDDLFYHPSWGVLVANEGRGNIYQWKDNRWRVLPDTKKVLRDTDSVTADADYVYVSDGSQGTIFRTDGKGEWEALWTKKDGLRHPEGIAAVDGALYVVDESQRSIMKLVVGKNPETWQPQHKDWRAPEGIVYDAKRGALVVTDDESGAVFVVDFGKTLTPIAYLSKPEDVVVAPDGRILVTDNGWGAVFAINRDGTVEKLAQFRRSYRDLQGITIDDAGRLYVVSSDGFDRVSFMPSMLFRITPPFLPLDKGR